MTFKNIQNNVKINQIAINIRKTIEIKDKNMINDVTQYLVVWDNNEETQESAENLTDCQESITDFQRLNQLTYSKSYVLNLGG